MTNAVQAPGEERRIAVPPGSASHPAPARDAGLVRRVPGGGLRPGETTVLVRVGGEERPAAVLSREPDGSAVVDLNDPLAGRTIEAVVRLRRLDAHAEYCAAPYPPPADAPAGVTVGRAELAARDGRATAAVWIAVADWVYDVSSAGNFYGPGAPYGGFAGRDASVALARFSTHPECIDLPWRGLRGKEALSLARYVRLFQRKYPCVGRLST